MVLRYKVMRTMKEVYRVLGVILGAWEIEVERGTKGEKGTGLLEQKQV